MRRPNYFLDQKSGLKTEIVAVARPGKPSPACRSTVKLTQMQWNSVRRAEGNGFYTWDTEQGSRRAGGVDGHHGRRTGAARAPLPNGGYFVLEATRRGRRAGYAP